MHPGTAPRPIFALMRERSLLTFVGVALLLALPAVVAVGLLDRFSLHLAMNCCHGPVLDLAFGFLTHLASGWVPPVVALLLLAKSWRAFLMVGLSAALGALAVQLLKHIAFPAVARPSMFLHAMPGLPLVEGVELHSYLSFPSGHSTSAFALCLALSVVAGRPRVAAGLALAAWLMAYSRVYLSQHFTEDILAGAMLGSLASAVVYLFLYKGKLASNLRLDRSPFRPQNQ